MQPIIDLSYRPYPPKKGKNKPGEEPLGLVILSLLPFALMIVWGVYAHL